MAIEDPNREHKAVKFDKVLTHPDKDKIIDRLVNGITSTEIANWLKNKYGNRTEFLINQTTLSEFKRFHLDVKTTVIEDLREKIKEQRDEEVGAELKETVKYNKTYNEKLEEFVDTNVNWNKKLLQFLNVVETRFGQLYDYIQNNPKAYKADALLLEYMSKLLSIVQEIRRIEGAPDQVIQHNITVQAVEQEAAVIQQAIIKTLESMDIATASIFIDKLNFNMQALKGLEAPTQVFATNAERDKVEKRIDNLMERMLPGVQNVEKITNIEELKSLPLKKK